MTEGMLRKWRTAASKQAAHARGGLVLIRLGAAAERPESIQYLKKARMLRLPRIHNINHECEGLWQKQDIV
ncbi:hypothetical protein [Leisingera sp. D0M16]|uniref:hypothetical protein n=1 Tax=Leisingera coralii TaxID=3351347 RepID=UPI003BA35774